MVLSRKKSGKNIGASVSCTDGLPALHAAVSCHQHPPVTQSMSLCVESWSLGASSSWTQPPPHLCPESPLVTHTMAPQSVGRCSSTTTVQWLPSTWQCWTVVVWGVRVEWTRVRDWPWPVPPAVWVKDSGGSREILQ